METTRTAYLPDAFLNVMRDVMPSHLSMESFIAACQRPLRRSLRVNTLKISVCDFLALVKPYGWQLTPIPWCKEGFWIVRDDDSLPLGSKAEHLSGLFYIQEASSMLPVTALFAAVPSPEHVLDMAAAPGSKTTQMAARMGNCGIILANEFASSRVKVLHANISRCGIHNVSLTHFDSRVFGTALPETFDAILLDAPCSGEGVVRKDPDALRNWSLQSNRDIATTQRELIDSAFHALKPDGVMVYSTCTLNQEENEAICHGLLDRFPGAVEIESLADLFPTAENALTDDGFLHIFPQVYDCEGFFVARLRKTRSVPPLAPPTWKLRAFPFVPLNGRAVNDITTAAAKTGLFWNDSLRLWQRDNKIWLLPAAIAPLTEKILFSRPGMRLAQRHNKGYRFEHEAVIALAGTANTLAFPLTLKEAAEWYHGRDIYPEVPPEHDNAIVTFQQQPLGLARCIGSRLKNSYPRELVRGGRLFT